jgi:hypothetical protein
MACVSDFEAEVDRWATSRGLAGIGKGVADDSMVKERIAAESRGSPGELALLLMRGRTAKPDGGD